MASSWRPPRRSSASASRSPAYGASGARRSRVVGPAEDPLERSDGLGSPRPRRGAGAPTRTPRRRLASRRASPTHGPHRGPVPRLQGRAPAPPRAPRPGAGRRARPRAWASPPRSWRGSGLPLRPATSITADACGTTADGGPAGGRTSGALPPPHAPYIRTHPATRRAPSSPGTVRLRRLLFFLRLRLLAQPVAPALAVLVDHLERPPCAPTPRIALACSSSRARVSAFRVRSTSTAMISRSVATRVSHAPARARSLARSSPRASASASAARTRAAARAWASRRCSEARRSPSAASRPATAAARPAHRRVDRIFAQRRQRLERIPERAHESREA